MAEAKAIRASGKGANDPSTKRLKCIIYRIEGYSSACETKYEEY